jgi:hypothetical protein
MCVGLLLLGDMIVVVDHACSRHFEGPHIKVHISLSNRNILESVDSWLEWWHCNANFLLPVSIPCVLEEFRILTGSLLDLNVRVGFKAADHL